MRQVRDFFWDEFADWYIELAKVRVREGDRSPLPVLVHVLDRTLRLLHPCMPFVTEEIWQRLVTAAAGRRGRPGLIVAAYPQSDAARLDDEAERTFAGAAGLRARHPQHPRREARRGRPLGRGVPRRRRSDRGRAHCHARHRGSSRACARCTSSPPPRKRPSDGVVTAVLPVGRVVLPMAGLFDLDAERSRLQKQIADAEGEVGRLEAKLGNEQFTRARAGAGRGEGAGTPRDRARAPRRPRTVVRGGAIAPEPPCPRSHRGDARCLASIGGKGLEKQGLCRVG